jgi:hypothetical protein
MHRCDLNALHKHQTQEIRLHPIPITKGAELLIEEVASTFADTEHHMSRQ